jgi:hypothetical protein
MPLPKSKAPPLAEPYLTHGKIRLSYRPKNTHNKMITGIGTPSSQSKIPRPIIASLENLNQSRNA